MTGRTLARRLGRLEARRGADTTALDAAAFLDRLGALGAAVQAAGVYTDTPGASPAERFLRAGLRGDGATAAAILTDATGGTP